MKKSRTGKKSRTNWAQLDAAANENIDVSDIPEITPEMFAKGMIRRGLEPLAKKKQVTLRVDGDVLTWFKKQGRGYQTRINTLLRAYVDEHERRMHPFHARHARGLSASSRRPAYKKR